MYNPYAIRFGQNGAPATPGSRGYNGPGIYRVTSPIGLTLYQGTSRQSFGYGNVHQGWDVEVLRDAGNGWFEVRGNIEWFKWENPPSGHPMQRRDNPITMGFVTGYVCASCDEYPIGSAWLTKISQDPAPAPAPYIPQYRVPVSYAVPGIRPALAARSRIGQLASLAASRLQPNTAFNMGPAATAAAVIPAMLPRYGGYTGPGFYMVTQYPYIVPMMEPGGQPWVPPDFGAAGGIWSRPATSNSTFIRAVNQGLVVRIVSDAGNGFYQTVEPVAGFLLLNPYFTIINANDPQFPLVPLSRERRRRFVPVVSGRRGAVG